MALVPMATRNRVNPVPMSNLDPSSIPYMSYGYVEGDRHHKHHHKKHHHHHHHHHHKKHKSFWNDFFPRGESPSSAVTVHSIELDERYPNYDRALVPVNQTDRQLVKTTTTQRVVDDGYSREAWVNNPTRDDEIVCCRAYNGCRCPCWCCIILIILTVILLIILIVLLATLL